MRNGRRGPSPSAGAYPKSYEDWVTLKDGTEIFLRPIKPADRFLIVELFKNLSPQSIYKRFLAPLVRLPQNWVQQLTNIDYKKDFALVALIKEWGWDSIIAVGRYAYNPRTERAELAVVVRDNWQGRGLGKTLLSRIIDIARENGFSRFEALIDSENDVIMKIIERLGYHYKLCQEEGGAYFIEIWA